MDNTSIKCAKAVLVMAAAFGLHGQTLAQDTAAGDDDKATVLPTGIDNLSGIDVTASNIKKYLSTGRPKDDLTKQVVLYNVGTKKFLNLGNYWGTHAALSDVPHVFWLQRKNDEAFNHDEYIRYPETAGSTTTSTAVKIQITSLLDLGNVAIGSLEGKGRSHAKYNKLQLVSSDGTATPLTLTDQTTGKAVTCTADSPYEPDGNMFTTADTGIDFYSQRLEAELDLTGCQCTNVGSNPEDALTIGEDITNFSGGGKTKLHFYAYKSGSSYGVRLQFIDKGVYAPQNAAQYDFISSTPIINIVLGADGLFLNGQRIFYTGLPIGTALTHSEKLYVANTLNGGGKATCGALNLIAPPATPTVDMLAGPITLTKDGTTVTATDGKFNPDGKKFTTEGDIDFTTQKLVVDIDMATATHSTNKNENTLSIGENITAWDSKSTALHMYFNGWPRFNDQGKYDGSVAYQKDKGYRFHLDFTGKSSYYQAYTDDASKNAGLSKEIFIPTENLITISTADGDKKVMRVELSKDGLYIGGKKISDSKADTYVKYLLSLSHIWVGSAEGDESTRGEGIRSHSTYYTIKTENLTEFKDKTLATTTTADGFTSEAFNLDNAYTLKTTLDVSACTAKDETVLSIGSAPSEWNTTAPGHENLHLRYHSTTADGQHVLEVAYVGVGYSESVSSRYIASADGKFDVAYSTDGLYLNNTPVFLADDVDLRPQPAYTAGKENDIVPYVTDDDNHLLIAADGKYAISESEGKGMKEPQSTYLFTEDSGNTLPVFITIDNLKDTGTSTKGKEGNALAWAPSDDNKGNYGNIGVFADRGLPEDKNKPEMSLGLAQWTFEKVASRTTGNVYTMSITSKTQFNVETKNENAPGGWELTQEPADTRMYLMADKEYVYSNSLTDSHKGRYYNDPDGTLISDITGAEAEKISTDEAQTNELAHWKIFTLQEYYELFKDEVSEMTNMLNLSFMLKDPNFKREQADLNGWTIDPALAGGKTRIGYDEYYKTATDQAAYTGASLYAEQANKKARNHGRYLGVEIKSQGAKGRFYQEFDLKYAGWYAITCQGMSNAGAKLFVQMIGADGTASTAITAPLAYVTKAERERLSATHFSTDGLPGWPYDWLTDANGGNATGMPFYNALVDLNDKNLNGGKNYEKYNAQVAIYIDPKFVTGDASQKLRFGVVLGDEAQQTATANEGIALADAADETVTADEEWTVFDNFQLLFGGNSEEPYLVIDENHTSLDHITSTIHHYSLRPMVLNRTFKAGAWNTVMLPVALTRSQFYSAFGSNAQLAELDHLTASTIEFKSVTATADDDVLLKANTPYIIKPEVADGGDTELYTARLYTRESGGKQYINVESPARHFFIRSVTLEGLRTDATGQYYYEFPSDFTYAGQVATGGGHDALQAYGTICRNYDNSTGKNAIISGRPDLKGCYVMSGSNLRKMSGQYGTKGLRCWFGPAAGAAESGDASALKVAVDGISDETTAIDAISAADDGVVIEGRFADGVYNLNGQKVASGSKTDGLASGLYIVNGKKYVKLNK